MPVIKQGVTMHNRADELERAAASAAHHRVAQGIPIRDPVAAGQQLSGRPPLSTKWLYIIAAVSGLTLLGLGLWLLAGFAPAHILIVVVVLFWIVGPFWRRNSGGK
jgi:hypothetical protein